MRLPCLFRVGISCPDLTVFILVVEFNQVVIFVKDKRRCSTLNKILNENKFPAIELHSDLSVEER